MKKFKIGDRIAIYDGDDRYYGVVNSVNMKSGLLDVRPSGRTYYMQVHYKQCRKLKSKSFKLEVGCWYQNRRGRLDFIGRCVSGEGNYYASDYTTYTSTGNYDYSGEEHPLDLIKKVKVIIEDI